MDIVKIVSYLVHPGKHLENPPLCKCTEILHDGTLFELLFTLFNISDNDCQIPVRFVMVNDNVHNNEIRNYIIDFIRNPTLNNGQSIAHRMSSVTTNRSKLGLLFLILGRENNIHKLVISRFPADIGILAEELDDESLQVEYIERIFMKNTTKYKAALYQGISFDADFNVGMVADKQLSGEMADYWIRDFLNSDFQTTSKEGTKNFAKALREAARKADIVDIKMEIVGVCLLAQNFDGRSFSVNQLIDSCNLSEDARQYIVRALPNEGISDDVFVFDHGEFLKHASYSSTEFDNGSIVLAPSNKFEECFEIETLDKEKHEYRYSTEGRIVDNKIRYLKQ
jgi:hypothetical protein